MRRTFGAKPNQSKANWAQALLATLLLATGAQLSAAQLESESAVEVKAESKRRVVVSIPARRLALVEDGRVVKTYAIAVGAAESPSPVGEFRIINRLTEPTYYRPGTVIPPGPANPLGTRWIGLDLRHYGIHGTNEPHSIGQAASHGCVRMRNGDVEELFEMLRVGDVVEVHAAHDEELARIFAEPQPVTLAAAGQGSLSEGN